MIKEILDERILNDGLTAKGWKKYNDGITKAVQVIREYQANDAHLKNSNCNIPLVANPVCRTCDGTGLIYIDNVIKNTLCPDC